MNIINNIIKLFDWIQIKLKSKQGIFILGLMVGILPSSVITYFLYLDKKEHIKEIVYEREQRNKYRQEIIKWQEKAFDAENECLERMLEIKKFFENVYNISNNEK